VQVDIDCMSLKSGIKFPYHNIGFVDKADYFKNICDKINKNLSGNYAVIYSTESVPDEQTRATIISNMEECGVENIQRHIDKGLLIIWDAESTYYKAGFNPERLEKLWPSSFSEIRKKLKNKAKGVTAIYSAEPYLRRNHYDSFIAFEIMTGKTFGNKPVELLCWYKKEWLSQLSFEQLVHLMTCHQSTVHKGWKYHSWNNDEIIDLTIKGIADILGEKKAHTLFEAVRMRFGLDRDTVVSKPELFADILKRMLGEGDANSVLNSIAEEYRQALPFDPRGKTGGDK